MGTSTVMLSFDLKKDVFDSERCHELYRDIPDIVFDGNAALQTVCDCGNHGDKMITATNENGGHVIIHLYHFAFLTVDITFIVDDMQKLKPMSKPYDLEFIRELEKSIEKHLEGIVVEKNCLCSSIKRAPGMVWRYGYLGDERLIELDYEEIVFETNSKWQNIKIVRSTEFGNILLLDDDIMIGDSDLIYTETLLGIGRNNFKGKEILILGGGDGGILHELLKQDPSHVLMAEIDQEVVKACNIHLKNVCGNALEKHEDKNYKIKICDCIQELKTCRESGKKYDYIINDLTEFSVDKEHYGFSYPFETSSVVLELSLQALKPDGKYLARGNCWSTAVYRNRFEDDVRALQHKFIRRDVHVPSFRETYCLYEVTK